jgi:hypothetical protein
VRLGTKVTRSEDFPGEQDVESPAGICLDRGRRFAQNPFTMVDILLSAPPPVADVPSRHSRPSLLDLRRSSNVDVDVRGVNDRTLLVEIASSMPRLFHHLVGAWAVEVRPADDRGRWLLTLHGAFGRHVWTFATTMEALPEAIAARLSGFFRAAAAAYRPPYVH